MIADRIQAIRERMRQATVRSGREADSVALVAVSKGQPAHAVREAFTAGIVDFGENRIQETEKKIPLLGDLKAALRWHFVGHLQRNKVRQALALFGKIHSVDSVVLGAQLARMGTEMGKVVHVLLQVDLAGEETKHGVPMDHLFSVLSELRDFPTLRVEGLMLLPPYDSNPEKTRPYFCQLRELRDQALGRGLLQGSDLSMGMSHDFKVAIEEGATLVRIGTAIFGG